MPQARAGPGRPETRAAIGQRRAADDVDAGPAARRRQRGERGPARAGAGTATAETTVLQAPPPELPFDRSLAGPGLLADTIVRRWQDHLPLHRLERIYGREGLELARSTICGWHEALTGLVKPLV